MPAQETTHRFQKAVLWTAVTTGVKSSDYGEHKVNAKIQILVRWEERRREAIDPNGNTIAVDIVAVVNQDIPVGSIMWLGDIDDVAIPPVDLKEVVTFNKIPDIKGRNYRRTVGLIRYSNELPTLA